MTSIIKHDDTGWISLDSYVSYRRKNGVVFVKAYWGSTTVNTSWTTKATLPDGFRPSDGVNFPCMSLTSAQVLGNVSTSGAIALRTNSGTANTTGFLISYPIV